MARASVQVGAQGPAGPTGPAGAQGPRGLQGPAGVAGSPLESARVTPSNTTVGSPFNGQPLVGLPTTGNTQPATVVDGADLLNGLTIPALDPGTYVVQVSLRSFADPSTINDTVPGPHYAVGRLFLDGASKLTLWTADVPADGGNAGTASDLAVITVSNGDPGQLVLRGADHADASEPDNVVGAGATVVVTQVNPGS